jgi:acetyl/propionyl-CoA carboxylase alpha subunit
MNTPLKVEHPVTEQVVGVDLVHAQLRVASGEALPFTQESLSQRGHAIECRIYAEDPGQGFIPQAGALLLYREPQGPGIRVDSGVTEGSVVSVHYDPMLAKLIVYAATREEARRRAIAALREYAILGIRTNIPFLLRLLNHPQFVDATVDTEFLDREAAAIAATIPTELPPAVIAAIRKHRTPLGTPGTVGSRGTAVPDPFVSLGDWRG